MNLFDRLPNALFGPLTGRHNRRTWDLLVRLSARFFGPECEPDYPDGYLQADVTREIERFLDDQKGGEDPDAEADLTPPGVQASQQLERLVETGWLVSDRVGLKTFISMRPIVARFFELLAQYAEEGPKLVSGDILLIHSQLKGAAVDPKGQAAGFQAAARLCRDLMNSLSATTLRVRDLTRNLTQESDTPSFVERFFSEHITEFYIRDFRQMRTDNHPLRRRYDIVDLVEQIALQEPARSQLLQGYRELPGAEKEPVEETLARDVAHFNRLLDVERFLARMDRVINTATERALAYLGYRLKATERLDSILESIAKVAPVLWSAKGEIRGPLRTPGLLLNESRLRFPNRPTARPPRLAMTRRELTSREKADIFVRKQMIRNRDITPKALQRYVAQHVAPGESVRAVDLPVAGVADAVAFLGLLRLGRKGLGNPREFKSNPLLRGLDFEVVLETGARVSSALYETTDFTVRRRANAA